MDLKDPLTQYAVSLVLGIVFGLIAILGMHLLGLA